MAKSSPGNFTQHRPSPERNIDEGRPKSRDRGTQNRIQASPKSKKHDFARDIQILIYASGYPKMTDTEVIRRTGKGVELKASIADFRRTAKDAQASLGAQICPAQSAEAFLRCLHTRAKTSNLGEIKRVIFVGHGSPHGLLFAPGKQLGLNFLENPQVQKVIKQIAPAMAEDATIDLYTCNIGIDIEFAQALAKAFSRRVRYWSERLVWCFRHDGKRVHYTGRMLPDSEVKRRIASGEIDPSDPRCKMDFLSIAHLIPPKTWPERVSHPARKAQNIPEPIPIRGEEHVTQY